MATVSSVDQQINLILGEGTLRPERFSALAETSFKSPLNQSHVSRYSKSSHDDNSRKRRISHSPVSVNTTYELSEKNTQKLWANFEDHIKKSLQKGHFSNQFANKQVLLSSNNINPLRKSFPSSEKKGKSSRKSSNEKQEESKFQLPSSYQKKNQTQNHPSFGVSENFMKIKPTFMSGNNMLSNQFTVSTKSDEKNRLLQEPLLKEIFKVSQEPHFSHQGTSSKLLAGVRNSQQPRCCYDSKGRMGLINLDESQNMFQFYDYSTTPIEEHKQIQLSNKDSSLLTNKLLVSPQQNTSEKFQQNLSPYSKEVPSDQNRYQYGDSNYNEFLNKKSKLEIVDYKKEYENRQYSFKNMVQQKIDNIQSEIKNSSSQKQLSNMKYHNLDEYLSMQTNNFLKSNQLTVHENPLLTSQSLIQSQQFNKTTSRFNNQAPTLNPQGQIQESAFKQMQFSPATSYNQTVETFDLDSNSLEKNTIEQDEGMEVGRYRKMFSPIRIIGKDSAFKGSMQRKSVQFSDEPQLILNQSSTMKRINEKDKKSTQKMRKSKDKPSMSSQAFSEYQFSGKGTITDQPYFYKDWSSKNSDKKNKRVRGSQNENSQDVENYSEIVDSISASMIQSKKSQLNKDSQSNSDCRRLMFNMINNLRHQRNSKENYTNDENKRRQSKSKGRELETTKKSTYTLALQEKFIQNQDSSFHKQGNKQQVNRSINVKTRVSQIQNEVCCLMNKQHRDDTQIITKLITCEKLLKQLNNEAKVTSNDQDFLLLRFYNAYLLVLMYKGQGEFTRISRFLEGNTLANINIKESLQTLFKKHKLKKELSNYLLHVQHLHADSLIIQGKYQKAGQILSEIVRIFDRWRSNQYSVNPDVEVHQKNEFGVDDFIEVQASEAECFFQIGRIYEAIDRFEQVKKDVQNQVVFDKPLLYINACNQLGNCYLKINEQERAMENFEHSYFLIQKNQESDPSQINISEVIISKICSNLAMISGNKGYLQDSIKMYEKALEHKMNVFPQFHVEILTSQLQVAQAYSKIADYDKSLYFYGKAFETSKNVNGEFDLRTANILTLQGHCFLKANKFSDSIKVYEHAGVVLNRIEQQKANSQSYNEINLNLSKLYLQLVNLYLLVSKMQDAQSVLNTLETRLDSLMDNENTYKIFNELGNVLRKHNNVDLAINYYKKGILSIKQIHKTNYLQMKETGKVLINIATCESTNGNWSEAMKHYDHTLQVLMKNAELLSREQRQQIEEEKKAIAAGGLHWEVDNFSQRIDVLAKLLSQI